MDRTQVRRNERAEQLRPASTRHDEGLIDERAFVGRRGLRCPGHIDWSRAPATYRLRPIERDALLAESHKSLGAVRCCLTQMSMALSSADKPQCATEHDRDDR